MHPLHHSPSPMSPLQQPSLVCVGGMLRVATPQHQSAESAQPTPPPSPTHQTSHNVTPFNHLASPFTASAPFTAPTTPFPHPTPTTTSLPLYPLLTPPTPPPDHPHTPPPPHTLTQKQVRELRRLCRKTANRAQFERRLIQIRQVASIAAMAASTLHLFDPGNPSSGHALRLWVDQHRATGADWRDERPLSHHAVAELRRWDLLLKAWARVRFEQQDNRAPADPHLADHHIKPVRLEFEKLGLSASPVPVTPGPQKPRNVYSTDFLRLASPVTPADGVANHLATPAANNNRVTSVPSPLESVVSPLAQNNNPLQEDPQRSAWSKPPLTGLTRLLDTRKPMAEVSINRIGDTIKVTVPPPKTIDNTRFATSADQENAIPVDLRRSKIHASTTAKSWRNALLQTPERGEDSSFRAAPKTLFPGHDAVLGVDVAPRSPLDWGKFRRGDPAAPADVWQRNDL